MSRGRVEAVRRKPRRGHKNKKGDGAKRRRLLARVARKERP